MSYGKATSSETPQGSWRAYHNLFGLALNVVFLVPGFGVAAWTHALYEVMIVTGFFG